MRERESSSQSKGAAADHPLLLDRATRRHGDEGIASHRDEFVADGLDARPEKSKPLGRFFACRDLVVVQSVIGPMKARRKIGHDHVGACEYTPLAPIISKGAESGRCRQQRVGMGKAQRREHEQGKLDASRKLCAEGRIAMGNEGADADHMRSKLLQKHHVARKAPRILARRSHHEPTAHLIAFVT